MYSVYHPRVRQPSRMHGSVDVPEAGAIEIPVNYTYAALVHHCLDAEVASLPTETNDMIVLEYAVI